MVNLVSTKSSDFFSTNLLSIWVAPSLYWVQDFVLPLAELCEIHPISPAYLSLCVAAWHFGVPTTPHSFVSPADLLRVPSSPSSRSFMKVSSSAGPSTDPWGTPLVTAFQLESVPLITTLSAWHSTTLHAAVHTQGYGEFNTGPLLPQFILNHGIIFQQFHQHTFHSCSE